MLLCAHWRASCSSGKIWYASFILASFRSVLEGLPVQHIGYAKTKSDTVAKLDGTFKMPEPDLPERQLETTEQTGVAAAVFGSAPAKAVPVNEQDRAKGTKRGREEEEEKSESEDDDEEMQMSESDEE
ncbi:uncharacterized protein N0V89_012587 [Didymosphaeria variabile]|uniref:Histone chaperone domain-containing protein n=1 Tax=Didymosphaeria variabile TaxID=1932322 RepID=A0A9W8X9H9_9PLEO|nr:uncharacterized protein N0V89_012587 [Didymosphaeria variabile]KAJ4344843.1 hypothetical protein N0V89_012587 [Didymosphaeria variabile]